MKIKFLILTILAVSILTAAGALFAEDSFSFELTEAFSFSEKTDNWSIEISLPKISGMPSEIEQDELNAYILSKKDAMLEDYEQNVVFGKQGLEEGYDPHFNYQYTWDVVTDNDDYFVFRISWFFGAGSSTTLNEYFNLDKKTGKLLDFDEDAVTSLEEMVHVYESIRAQMDAANEESQKEYGANIFWTEDDSLDIALGNVRYLNHWYYDQDGNLVIAFDKYEVAPGAMGSPEFVISAETEPAA